MRSETTRRGGASPARARRAGLAFAPLAPGARLRAAFPALAALGVLSVAGCFRHHERGEADAGADARVRDTGARPRDAGSDAGMPCRLETAVPTEPLRDDEPIVPSGRPSARAEALGWLEPPEPTGPACCDVRSVVTERLGCLGSWPPIVARGTDRWGVLTAVLREGADFGAAFVRLGIDRGLPERVPAFRDWPVGMAGGNHRFAVLTRSSSDVWPPPPSVGALVVLDEAGAPRVDVRFPDGQAGRAIARVPAQHGWAVLTVDEEGAGPAVALSLLDESLRTLHSFDLTRGMPPSGWGTPVALGDRVVVVGDRGDALVARVVEARTGTDLGEHVIFHDPSLLGGGTALGAAAARDEVLIVFGAGTAFAISFDPFSFEADATPVRLESRRPPAATYSLASDDVGGTVGVCVQSSPADDGRRSASFFVIDGRGRPLGRAMELEGDAGLGCHAAATGRDTYEVLHGAAELAPATQRWTRTTLTVRR